MNKLLCCYNIFTNGAVAQLGERLLCTEEVRGSSPLSSTSLITKPVFALASDKKAEVALIQRRTSNEIKGAATVILMGHDATRAYPLREILLNWDLKSC